MPTGKGFIDKSCLNYILKFSKETVEAKKLRIETSKMKSNSQMISDLDSAEIIKWVVKLINAKRCLEIGVFTGYTTLLLAQAIPKDGTVIGFERKEEWVNIGR
jgi:predicted O-methyltransferase YrrM